MVVTSIFKKQKIIINNLKKYNDIVKNNYEDIFYFNAWSENFGNFFIKKKFLKTNFIFEIKMLLKLFNKKLIFKKTKFNIKRNFVISKIKKKKNLIISFQINKNKDFDYYFGCERSKTKNSIWLLINSSNQIINTHFDSIVLNKKNYINFIEKIFFFLFYFPFWCLKKKKKIIENNFFNVFDIILSDLFVSKIKKVYLPYEAQPFQKYLINIIKNNNRNIKIIGYVHGGLPSVPLEYYPNLQIDKLIVHSKSESDILIKIFGWKKKQIKIEKAFRFNNNKIKKNFIYLPYDFHLTKNLYNDLKYLFNNYYLDDFEIANHPAMLKSKKHKFLIKMINNFKNKKIYNKKLEIKNSSIFIGVTGSILEGLQNKLNIIHLMNFPELELYSSNIWKNISNKRINDRIYTYSLINGNLLKYSQSNSFIKKYNL